MPSIRQLLPGMFIALLILSMIPAAYLAGPFGGDPNDDSGAFEECPDTPPAGMACVPGGRFIIGSDTRDWSRESRELSSFPEREVTLSTFLIDKYEVTTAEYQACVRAGNCQKQRSNYPHMRGDRQPMLKANWYQARVYCSVQGKRLPTEAEFEAASRGPQGETYPWGNAIASCRHAVIKDKTGRGCAGHPGPGFQPTPARYRKTGNTRDVGSLPPGRYGLYDMAGNAQEWVSDWFAPNLRRCGADCSGRDPRGPCKGADRCPGFKRKLVKGGSWYWGPIAARAAARRPYGPKNSPPHHFGFRCARSL